MIGIAILILIAIGALPIIIISLIISAIVKKNKENKKDFEETIRNIYVYAILIITVVIILTSVISIFRTGLDVLFPSESMYDTSYENEKLERNSSIIGLFTEMALVIIIIPIFKYHNEIAKNTKKVKVEEINNDNINQ